MFDRFHRENPRTTVPVHLCCDTGHGISNEESFDPSDVVEAIRDRLNVPRVLLFLEVPGKRGREIGERRAIDTQGCR